MSLDWKNILQSLERHEHKFTAALKIVYDHLSKGNKYLDIPPGDPFYPYAVICEDLELLERDSPFSTQFRLTKKGKEYLNNLRPNKSK